LVSYSWSFSSLVPPLVAYQALTAIANVPTSSAAKELAPFGIAPVVENWVVMPILLIISINVMVKEAFVILALARKAVQFNSLIVFARNKAIFV